MFISPNVQLTGSQIFEECVTPEGIWIRDRQGGHGAAPGDNSVPDHISAFALHLTAANIVLLVKAHIALPLKASPASPDR
jgi:hypothetical protein